MCQTLFARTSKEEEQQKLNNSTRDNKRYNMEQGRSRGGKKKECKECGYLGKVNEEKLCGSCDKIGRKKDEGPPHAHDVCKHCRRRVNQDDDGILCDDCNLWHHAHCEKVGEQMFRAIEKGELNLWFCEKCSKRVKETVHEAKKLKLDNAEMKRELNSLKEGNVEMMNKMIEYRTALEDEGQAGQQEQGKQEQGSVGAKREVRELREELGKFVRQME